MDGFIEKMQEIRKALLGVSISAIILAPVSIALSAYLFLHPAFYAMLDREDDFGEVLVFLLSVVMSISSVWLITGMKHYRSITQWNNKYVQYLSEKEEAEKIIAKKYELEGYDETS